MRGKKAKTLRMFVDKLTTINSGSKVPNTMVHKEVKIFDDPPTIQIISSYDAASPRRIYKDAKRMARDKTNRIEDVVHFIMDKVFRKNDVEPTVTVSKPHSTQIHYPDEETLPAAA